MSKEKQIEEIKDHIDSIYGCDCAYYGVDGFGIATELYNAGYRKQSEVVKAIADFMYDGEIEGLAISMSGAFLTKNEFIDKFAERR